jgi:hypothetical protein
MPSVKWKAVPSFFVTCACLLVGACGAADRQYLGTGDLPDADIRVSFADDDWEKAADNKLNYECKKESCGVGSSLIVWLGRPQPGERERFISGEYNEAYIDILADRSARDKSMKKIYVKRIVQPNYAGYEMMMQTTSLGSSHKYFLTRGAYNNRNYISVSSRANSEELAKRNIDAFFRSVTSLKQG